VKFNRRELTVMWEYDQDVQSGYMAWSKNPGPVAETFHLKLPSGRLLADVDQSGRIVGIETVGDVLHEGWLC